MFAIDRLIHEFHWDLAAQLPNRPAANNLIEGSLQQVIALLDQLATGMTRGLKRSGMRRWRS